MAKKTNTPENQLDEFIDLSPAEIKAMHAWNNFALTKSETVKASKFNLEHWRKVKKARLCAN